MDKKEEWKQLACQHMNLLEDGFMQDGIKCVHHIHLQHHPVDMDIQSNLNTKHQCFTPTSNYHAKLMKWQVKKEHILKLET